jgi:hypothetical protein
MLFNLNKPFDMKQRFLAAAAALVLTASVHAQSTVDSIAAKYKLLPMPAAITMEQTFPVIGNYQLSNSTEGAGTVTVSLDSSNKGIVWVEGLPQGRMKAYLKKSPSTYRILSQKAGGGKQVQEGTLHYDTTSHELHIALGKAYNEADPTAIFAMNPQNMGIAADSTGAGETETKIKSGDDKMKTEVKGNKVKVKSKTGSDKNKTKLEFYTATKIMQNTNMMDNNMQMQQSDSTQHSDSTHQQ